MNNIFIFLMAFFFCTFLLLAIIKVFNTNHKWKKILDRMIQESEINRRQSEENSAFLQNIIDHLEEGILLIDSKEKIIFNNQSGLELLNLGNQLKDTYFWEVFRNQDFIKHVKEALIQKKKFVGEFILPSSTEKNIAYQIIPLLDRFQIDEKRVLVVLDETTKLRKLERIRTDFVSNVSHELKGPLGAILGYVETLQEDGSVSVENRKKFTEVIHKNVIKLIAIVEDLLVLSRVESGDVKEFTGFDPQEILLEVIELYKEKINEKQLNLAVTLPDTPLKMMASKFQIRQVILNLLDNAIKYTNPHGSIAISLTFEDESIVFTFTDTGIGIPFYEQERIFERFYQVDKSRHDGISGTGLGLSIVKHIVEMHKGHIILASQLNHGSTFKIFFPLNLTQS